MATEIYIGNEIADYEEDVVLTFSAGDLRDIFSGSINSSYDIELPLTQTNKRILKYNNELNVIEEPTEMCRIIIDNVEVLRGKIFITGSNQKSISVIIRGSSWIDDIKNKRMTELDFSSENFLFTSANVQDSWVGSNKFYRYPMINFGQLWSQEKTSTSNWQMFDFIPMFRLVAIIQKIFYPWAVAGSWISTFVDDYVLGKEIKAPEAFIGNKNMEARALNLSDNVTTKTFTGGVDTISFSGTMILINTYINQGGHYSNPYYTVPEAGTYHFTYKAVPLWTADTPELFSIISQQQVLEIKRTRGGSTITIATQTTNYVSTDILNGITYTLSSGYYHFEAGDIIFGTYNTTMTLNNTSYSQLVTLGYAADVTKLYLTWDEYCRYTGNNKLIEIKKHMTDVSCVDFLKGLKDAYNLKFHADVLNGTVYIETGDVFRTQNEISLSDKIDFYGGIKSENISSEYHKKEILRFITDDGDKAVEKWLAANPTPYTKEITFNSTFVSAGINENANRLFASTMLAYKTGYTYYDFNFPSIYGKENQDPLIQEPYYRAVEFKPRLLRWYGMTSGITWYYEKGAKTTYPKVLSLDMADLYSSCWIKTFHLLDGGKIISFEIVNNPLLLQQFVTVISDGAKEGFRALYKFTIGSETYAGYLNKIEFDSSKALIELTLKI